MDLPALMDSHPQNISPRTPQLENNPANTIDGCGFVDKRG
jgi:hypothetical protein